MLLGHVVYYEPLMSIGLSETFHWESRETSKQNMISLDSTGLRGKKVGVGRGISCALNCLGNGGHHETPGHWRENEISGAGKQE